MPTPIHALRFPFSVDAGLGQLREETDRDAYIAQLVRQVILTSPGERINRPTFGAGLSRQVFEATSIAGGALVETMVIQALERWLGALIRVENVTAAAEGSTLRVDVRYRVIATGGRRFLNLEIPSA